MKLLLIALTFAAALWLIRSWRASNHTGARMRSSSAEAPQAREPQWGRSGTPPQASEAPVDMVQCAFCGLHVPRHEAFCSPARDHHYCCEAHRIEHLRQRAATRSG